MEPLVLGTPIELEVCTSPAWDGAGLHMNAAVARGNRPGSMATMANCFWGSARLSNIRIYSIVYYTIIYYNIL